MMAPGGAWQVIGAEHAGGGLARETPQGEFDHPNGIAVDGSGNVWVVEIHIGRIQMRTPGGEWKVMARQSRARYPGIGTAAGQFHLPSAIAVDGADRVWVTVSGNHSVQGRTVSGEWEVIGGKPVGGDGGKGTAPGEFFLPMGIAVDGTGAVWVADTENHRIQVWSPGVEWRVIGVKPGGGDDAEGTRPGEFRLPSGVAIDTMGAVWVADTGNHRIQRFGSD